MHRSLLLVLLLATSPALADDTKKAEAKVHIDKATAAHKEGRFADAQLELNAAYALDPQPPLLYALGQVNVKLGRCGDAIRFYEQFIDTKPAPAAADAATQAIVTCRVALEQAQAQAPTGPGADLPPADGSDREPPPGMGGNPPPAAHVDQVGPTPWYKAKLGLALVGTGTVAAVVGVVLYTGARGKIDDAEAAPSYAASQALVDDAKSQRTLSVVFGVAGAALLGGGIVYYMKRDPGGETRRVSVIPTTAGGLVTLSGQF